MGKMVGDMGSAMSGALVLIGDRLGLYKALAEGGAGNLRRTRQAHRHDGALCPRVAGGPGGLGLCRVRSGYAPVLDDRRAGDGAGDEASPVYVAGAFDVIASAYLDEPKVTAAFRTGNGVGWHEHHSACSAASSGSSAAAIPPSSSRSGSRPSTG